ncbi:hypothetical protein [Sinimarinibacterium flocculans]|uniref:hypothetical protein n=1 Tax=Sinimarinibacterium flocculans TaxID=985250 RepID=UPI0024913646|nr:hypothetical protein [Sinimarinibacterium flocculans]
MSAREQELALIQRRLLLGGRLRAQRQLIIGQIKTTSGAFPRSVTMRLLLWQPALTLRLALGIAAGLRRGWRQPPGTKP